MSGIIQTEEGATLGCGQEEKLVNKVETCKRRRIEKGRFYGSKERRPFQGEEWP